MPEGKEKEKVEMRMGIKNGDLESVINNFWGLSPLGTGQPIASWQLILWG
jgi:hypothetical protein